MFRSHQSVSCVTALLAAVAVVPMVMGETVVALQDDFSAYTSNEGLRAAWHNGNLFRGVDANYDPSPTPSYMSNNNQPGYRVCDPLLTTNRDWSVKFDLLTKTPSWTTSLAQKAWLVNYDAGSGTVKGYGINWDLGLKNQYGSEGLAKIRRLDTTTVGITNINTTGDPLSSAWSNHYGADGDDPGDGTGDDALDLPMAVFELTWTASTKTLSLYVDGSLRTSYVETAPLTGSFNRLYLVGNSNGYFDDVRVTTDVQPKGTLVTVF